MMLGAVLETATPLRQRIDSALKSSSSRSKRSKSSLAGGDIDAGTRGHRRLPRAGWIIICASALISLTLAAAALGMIGSGVQMYVLQFAAHHRLLTAALALGAQSIPVLAVAAYATRSHKLQNLLAEIGSEATYPAGAAAIGQWHWNADTGLIWLADEAKEILGLDPAEPYDAAGLAALANPDDLTALQNAVVAGAKSGEPFDATIRLVAKEGEPVRSLRCRGGSQTDQEGRVTRVGGTLLDVSDLAALQTEIARQQQSLIHLSRVGTVGKLSGALAHELSQPLTAIMHNAHAIKRMLDQKPINVPELQNAVSEIIEDDSRVRDVIGHLRSLLKKDESGFDRVDMALLIHKVLGLVRKELAIHRIKVVANIAPDLPPVWGDGVQLQQLLLNLITNAIDAIEAGAKPASALTIMAYGVETPGINGFHLCISDTGNGLPAEAVDRVFDAFYSTKEQGLGLGLSISQAIVSGHKGTIRAENNSQGGATFHVTLPTRRGNSV